MITAPLAALTGAGLATCGWLYTARRARALAKKQHTVNVMLQASFNAEFQAAVRTIGPFVRNGNLMDLAQPGKETEVFAFRRVANHYEFMASGLRNGDFYERLIRDSERASIVTFFEKSEQYIRSLRNVRRRIAIYEHLEWLADRWERKRPGRMQKCFEWVIGRPLPGRRANPH
jgi:hypothetical protein